jgi:uncharacterized protein (TIGR02099 family)
VRVLLPKVVKRLWYVAAVCIILAALLVSGGRLLTPYLNSHLPDFERWASSILKAPVSIEKVYIAWDVYEPTIILDEVKFLNGKTHKPDFQIDHANINFSIIRSFIALRPLVESITISGVHLTVRQGASGLWNISGLTELQVTDNVTGTSLEANAALVWIFGIPQLMVKDVNVMFYPEKGKKLSFSLNDLALSNSDTSHTLSGKAVLNQEIPTRLTLNLKWRGNLNDLPHVTAQTYVYLEAVNLPQWVGRQVWHDLQIKQGLGSLKLWANWDQNAWQKVQTRMQFYDLEVQSLLTTKTLMLSRFSGSLGWRQEGQKQIFAGDQIFLDLPNHLWPVTALYVELNPDKNGAYFPDVIKTSYLDLSDLTEMANTTGVLPEVIKKQLSNFNPKGEVTHFQFKRLTQNPITGTSDFSLNANFAGLSFNAWETYPGLMNVKGMLAWNGSEGDLTLDSLKISISYKQYFSQNLQFDRIATAINVKHDASGSWILDIKNFVAANADVMARFKLIFTSPLNASPTMNLMGNFSFVNAAHVARYIPTRQMDPDLSKWLRNAFLAGQFDEGKFTIQGALADFPFDRNNGKFLVSTQVKNLEFNFAPGWPIINHFNGELIFAGRVMTVNMTSGQMFNVPLGAVHGVIPYIGDDQPQILHIDTQLKSDLSDLVHFIHQSPLEKKIGVALGSLNFSGIADLKLGMVIPLRRPEKLTLQGDLLIPDATLGLPDTQLALKQLQGSIHFTEDDITAKNLQGKFLAENAELNITTQHPVNSPSYVLANLQSQINLATIQSLFNLPISSLAQGKTGLTAELKIYSQELTSQTSEASLHTDLKGVSLNLPLPYGKKAEEICNLQVDVMLKNQLVRAKLAYNKLLTAALDFQRSEHHVHFFSGEVALGGNADWQAEPGLLLSGTFKQLDWETLQHNFTTKTTPSFDTSFFRGINLNVGVFNIFGQKLNDAHIKLLKENAAWAVNLNSREMVGQLNVVTEGLHPSIHGKFERLYLKSVVDKNKSSLDPRNLPALSLIANDVRYEDKSFGTVTLNMIPTQTQLTVEELRMESPVGKLQAKGSWQFRNDGSSTSYLAGDISTSRLNDLLDAWGVGSDNFVGAKGRVDFDLNWPGALYQPRVSGMSGSVSIALGAGRIVNVGESNNAKMDLGRLLNLFSISAIPRRLSLDFSDVTEKGYGFDYIKGDFSLRNGNAFTDNASSDGAIARIDISGRIGLAAQDFNLVVGVTPHVAASLPAVVMLWNPFAGAAAWAVGQMVGGAMSKSTLYHYTVRGPWDNPVWKATH